MSAVADVLNGAADLIERCGWTQGFDMRGGCVCVGKAVELIADDRERDGLAAEAFRALEHYLGFGSPKGFGYYVHWNDAPGRTQAEVVAALRAAAERAS